MVVGDKGVYSVLPEDYYIEFLLLLYKSFPKDRVLQYVFVRAQIYRLLRKMSFYAIRHVDYTNYILLYDDGNIKSIRNTGG